MNSEDLNEIIFLISKVLEVALNKELDPPPFSHAHDNKRFYFSEVKFWLEEQISKNKTKKAGIYDE